VALAESMDFRTTLAEVARLAVPFLADWCAVDVLEGDGRLAPVAAVHMDPTKQALLRELRGGFPVVAQAQLLSAEAVRTRAPVLIAEVDEQRLAAAVPSPRHLELLRAIGVRSVLAVPLVARGRALGAITAAFASSGRRYQPADVALAQELARRAAIAVDNARLYHQAQEAIRLRDEFLTVASHELNTPVTSLRLSLSPFLNGEPLPPPATVSRLLAIVDRQSERLASLVGEMLDVARVQAGSLPIRPQKVDLTALVRQTTTRLKGSLAQARCPLSLALEDAVVGRWDPAGLEQVITNLVGNALKFGAGKPIEVTLRRGELAATLAIADHGLGIERDQMGRIFDRFARAVSAEHYGGLGLGLFIAREIVTGLGGTIGVESAPGAGATFTVTLPFAGP
jgi:signal transduction histidine kinase